MKQSRISKTTLFGMLEVYHTGIMDAFQSFQRLHLWAYRTAGRLHLEPNSVARQVVLARLDTVLERLGRHQRDIASWNSRSGLVMDALVERRLTYGEKVRLTVEVRRLSENLRGETAVMAELMEVVGTDSSDWRETPVV